MRRLFSLLYLAGIAASLSVAVVQLRKISGIMQQLKLGAAPSAGALPDGTDIPRPAAAKMAPEPETPPVPAALSDTNSSRSKLIVKDASAAPSRSRSGGAVLIDKETGRRLELLGSPKAAPTAPARIKKAVGAVALRKLDVTALPLSADLETRRRQACGILLGTTGLTGILVWRVRRSFMG